MKRLIYFLFSFFVFLFLFIFLNRYFKKKEEYNYKYDFTITKIMSDPKGYLIFNDSLKNTYSFVSFEFIKWDNLGVKIGDRIIKNSRSNILSIYRKNPKTEKLELFLKKQAY